MQVAIDGASVNPLIFCPDRLFAVSALESSNRKMTSRYILKMFDERIIHGCASNRADYWKRLRSHLLCHDQTESGCHLRHETDEDRAPFLNHTAFSWAYRRSRPPIPTDRDHLFRSIATSVWRGC